VATPSRQRGLRLADVSVGAKLGGLLVVPLLAIIGLASVAAYVYADQLDHLNGLRTQLTAGVAAGDLIDALQHESLDAARLVAEPANTALTAFTARAAPTDAAAQRFQSSSARLPLAAGPITRDANDVGAALAGLPELRARATQRAPAALTGYADLIATLVAFRDAVNGPEAVDGAPAAVGAAARSVATLTAAKAGLATAQADVVRVLGDTGFTPPQLRAFVGARSAYTDNLNQLRAAGPAAVTDALSQVLTRADVAAADTLADQFADAGPGRPVRVDGGATHWIELSGAQLGALRSVEQVAEGAALHAVDQARSSERGTLLLWAGLVLLVVVISVALATVVARSIVRSLRQASLGGAADAVQREAARAQAEQAALRESVSTMFINLARRSSRLVDGLIERLDEAERTEADPDRLAELFGFDHLATRMRHANDSLLVLAGSDASRAREHPISLIDLLRAAQSQIEQYQRVEYGRVDDDVAIAPHAVDAVVHVLAELLDNAARFSPPDRPVFVDARRTGEGATVQITDEGLGVGAALDALNARLADPPGLGVADSRSMGLAVVARLARRHQLAVELQARPGGGTIALVRLPADMLRPYLNDSPTPLRNVTVLPRPLDRHVVLPGGEPIDFPSRTKNTRKKVLPLPRRVTAANGNGNGNGHVVGVAKVSELSELPGSPGLPVSELPAGASDEDRDPIEPDEARALLSSFQLALGQRPAEEGKSGG
jgi:signal transduction histidine kinase